MGAAPTDLKRKPGEGPAVQGGIADQVGRQGVTDGVAGRQVRGAHPPGQGMKPEEHRHEMEDQVPGQVVTARVDQLMGEDGPEIGPVGRFAIPFRQQEPRSKQAGQAGCGDFRRLDDTNGLPAAERRGNGAALRDDSGLGPPWTVERSSTHARR